MRRYTLAPAAARDLVEIYVETIIHEKIVLLAGEQRVSLKLGQKSPSVFLAAKPRGVF